MAQDRSDGCHLGQTGIRAKGAGRGVYDFPRGKQKCLREHGVAAGYGQRRAVHAGMADVELGTQERAAG